MSASPKKNSRAATGPIATGVEGRVIYFEYKKRQQKFSYLSLIVKLIIILTMSLSDTQRIEILILLGCGDKTRTQKQICEIFNTKYPDCRIFQSTVSRIENKFHEFGNVTDIPKSGRKRILDDKQKLDILLDIQDNPHKPTRQVSMDSGTFPVQVDKQPKNSKIFKIIHINLQDKLPQIMILGDSRDDLEV
ncbi:hypothetical protein NQ318_012528 [Aromia moschata]|uniref:Uncharacterized protein n=1 Tax=Aromia moschata TaxID=1265417 RepID=A0AAV8XEL0_9CUCU|nr:hypothetical protein NQ318_012528 [Aromia moschata]